MNGTTVRLPRLPSLSYSWRFPQVLKSVAACNSAPIIERARKKRVLNRNYRRVFVRTFVNYACMKTPLLLLLTNDPILEDAVAQALSEAGGLSHLTGCASDALRTVCGVGPDLDLAVIDFEHTGHGLSLVSAISMRHEDLPIIVVRRDDEKYVEALAYASGATACLAKPVTAAEILAAIKQCRKPKPQRALVA